MARYFLRKKLEHYNYGNDPVHHYMSAVSDKPNEQGNYPTAMMHVVQRPGIESPNFQFNKTDDDLQEFKERLSEHQFSTLRKISNDIGRSATDIVPMTGDDLEGIDSAAYYLKGHAREKADYQRYKNTDYGASHRAEMRDFGISYAKEIRNLRRVNDQLFTPSEDAGTHVVEANASPEMRHAIPVMGSFFNQKFGKLTAGQSLSRHSSKLMSNVKERGIGVVKDSPYNVTSRKNNAIDFRDSSVGAEQIPKERNYVEREHVSMMEGAYTEREVHPVEIKAAKQNLRTLLGRPASKPLSNQFDQPKLPGME